MPGDCSSKRWRELDVTQHRFSALLDRRLFLEASAVMTLGVVLPGCTDAGEGVSSVGVQSRSEDALPSSSGSSSDSDASGEGTAVADENPDGSVADSAASAEETPAEEVPPAEEAPPAEAAQADSQPAQPERVPDESGFIEATVFDRGFAVDEVLRHPTLGDIHFSMHIPDGYDGSVPYALYVHCPGGEGWYTEGLGTNLHSDFVFVANDYVSDMIVITPQLEDWGETSADMAIELTLWALRRFNLDESRVYLSGYSFGGETISFVMAKRPELYRRVLHLSSQWDGSTDALVEAQVPLKIVLGDADEWYTVPNAEAVRDAIRLGYEAKGLPASEIDELVVLDVKDDEYFEGSGDQHGSGIWRFSHDADIMGWLFR